MKSFLKIAMRTLVAAANGRARIVLGQQAALAQPAQVDYRANAGGWN